MSSQLPIVWLALASMVASFVLAASWRVFALRRGHVDQPDARRLHVQPTPRGGGIGIALVLLALAPWLGEGAAAFAGGLVLCAGAGLVDDLRPLPPLAKLLLQAAGALCLASAWPLLPGLWGVGPGIALGALLVLAMVNLWNFMDGANGLAASQALVAAPVLALLGPTPAAVLLAAVLAAASLGFLPLNFPRARLFLGDVGSHALGYGLAALALLAAPAAGEGAWLLLLPASAMLLDASLTLLSRLRRRQVLWQAHREHLYQRAVAAGWSHAGVCGLYLGWALAASLLALSTAGRPAPWPWLLTLLALVVGIILHLLLSRRWPRPQPQPPGLSPR
ncbi:lipopolysaccharide biosynthesis protein [Arenimonas caeni]|uniref:Lipopolysaccharide biosynthesis protein n=1 Tax=Arenimonas caeni TaxID=2058085 RepID=A0A2P6MAX1_9GAMM|nr:lipopolysaccharide biosynthesis protein [Arenimonas caeni]PRH83136.1 lipopolysaccharide biosynthesis protein [Arenimonas caeni]